MKQIYSIIFLFAGTLFSVNGFAQAKVTGQQAGATSQANPETQVSKFDIQIQGKGVPDTATVYVRYITGKKLTLAPVHFKKGKAEYQAMITEPTLIMLFLARDGGSFNSRNRTIPIEKLSFYADPREKGAKISFKGNIKEAEVVSGSLEKAFQQYTAYLKPYDAALELLYKERGKLYEPGAKDEVKLGKVNAAIGRNERVKDSAKLEFAKQYPSSYFALLGLKEAAGFHIDAEKIDPIFKGLSTELKESPMGIEFGKQIALAHKLRVGQQAPDFLQYDTTGKAVRLSDFKGKYILLDFWASWCAPCRAQNPQVVALYQKFKGKNFEIIGVSLDNQKQRDKWLKAIEHDHLTWIHVSDLKGWQNEAAKAYGIQAVPQNYLIGPDGKIVGEDMEMGEVKKVLKEIL